MKHFTTIDEVEGWLEPMNYEEFWLAVAPYHFALPKRAACDADISAGATPSDVLTVLKALARHQLIRRHRLTRKPVGPVLHVVGEGD